MYRIIFFGSSPYSVTILQSLLKVPDFRVITVVSKTDKPIGRQQQVQPNPVSQFARQHHLPLLQPLDFNNKFITQYQKLKPDLGLIVAYGPPYFTLEMINIPQYKVVNIHPSPLPKYRGATPGPWQVINGETESAVTFFQIDEKPDHGPIIAQIPFPILPTETTRSFYQKAFDLAASNLENTLKSYIKNPNKLIPQDHHQRSYFPKFTKDTAKIDWSWQPQKIERFVRAMQPWPIAWTDIKTRDNVKMTVKIFSGKVKDNQFIPDQVQIQGKKPTSWDQIKNYYRITP